jgi:hypothetical protein
MVDHRIEPPAATHLHPVVYAALLGFVSWLVIAVWGFARDGLTDYLMVIVSGFIVLFAAIPATLFLMVQSQRTADQDGERDRESFRDWAAGEFGTWQDRVKGANAAVEILLPIAALAVGMTAFAVVAHYTIPSV